MKRTLIVPDLDTVPAFVRPFLDGAAVYDSSCSSAARVWFLDRDAGYYLKTAPKGTLAREAAMTGWFHTKGLAAEVLAYECLESDWLLTARIPGEDCTFPQYLEDPVRLCDTTAALLRMLHELDPSDCPVADRTGEYRETARKNYLAGNGDLSLLGAKMSFFDREDAWQTAEAGFGALQTDTLLHGDYCLPNIMLDNWRFRGFLDLDTAGVGDRHVDLFWGMWSLWFNLKTDRYCDRFLDAYGRDKVDKERLRTVAAIEVFG